MAIKPSTEQELRDCVLLVRKTRHRMKKLVRAGKKVHVIWDVDHVLVSGRSDDVFALLGFDVVKYFLYEERLLAERLEKGPWYQLARRCGKLHQSQDIVTARSSFLALRAIHLLLEGQVPSRWQLFVGHQSKKESYRIILDSFKKDPDMHVFSVDDAAKHCDAFNAVAAELGMSERCHAVLSPQIRKYDEDELRREIAAVLDDNLRTPAQICVTAKEPGTYGRFVTVVPDGREYLRDIIRTGSLKADMAALVETNREALEKFADQVMPGKPKTVENLFFLSELLREPA